MFSNPKRPDGLPVSETTAGANTTVIARGVRVEGQFASQGDVVIEGEVIGNVSAKGRLIVGPEAKLKADVTADEAVVAGAIDGNLTITKRLELKTSARIAGDLSCETIGVEPGATLNGKVSVGGSSPKASSSKS